MRQAPRAGRALRRPSRCSPPRSARHPRAGVVAPRIPRGGTEEQRRRRTALRVESLAPCNASLHPRPQSLSWSGGRISAPRLTGRGERGCLVHTAPRLRVESRAVVASSRTRASLSSALLRRWVQRQVTAPAAWIPRPLERADGLERPAAARTGEQVRPELRVHDGGDPSHRGDRGGHVGAGDLVEQNAERRRAGKKGRNSDPEAPMPATLLQDAEDDLFLVRQEAELVAHDAAHRFLTQRVSSSIATCPPGSALTISSRPNCSTTVSSSIP